MTSCRLPWGAGDRRRPVAADGECPLQGSEISKMTLYVLSTGPTRWDHWGDYADILIHGMSAHRPRRDGLLQLERVGPYAPPIIFPGVSDIVLTDHAKQLVASKLDGVSFRPVVLAKCVRIDWTEWDADRDEPAEYPDSGEPEDYILSRPHNAGLATALGSFWELVPDVDEAIQGRQGRLRESAYQGQHLVRAALSGGYNFVSTQLRDALLEAAPGCLSASAAVVERDS